MVADTATKRAERIEDELAGVDLPVEYTVEAHTSRDVGFDIVQTARNDDADLVLMGYPEEHHAITEKVEYDAPCDVTFVSGFDGDESFETVTIGAGGGPHHVASLGLVRRLGLEGSAVNVVSVKPVGGGTAEDPDTTTAELEGVEDVHVQSVSAASVADGLVDHASRVGGVLVIGASRDRRLRRWVLGSTPDRVVERAAAADVPVIIYASSSGVQERFEDYLFPVYRYLRKFFGRSGATPDRNQVPQ